MKFCIAQAIDQNCVFIRCAGLHDVHDVWSMMRVSKSLDFYQKGVSVLMDMRLVDSWMSREAAHWLASVQPHAPVHTSMAIVADSDEGFEMVNYYSELRGHSRHRISGFRSMSQALPWLGIPGAPRQMPAKVAAVLNDAVTEADRTSSDFNLAMVKVATGRLHTTEKA